MAGKKERREGGRKRGTKELKEGERGGAGEGREEEGQRK